MYKLKHPCCGLGQWVQPSRWISEPDNDSVVVVPRSYKYCSWDSSGVLRNFWWNLSTALAQTKTTTDQTRRATTTKTMTIQIDLWLFIWNFNPATQTILLHSCCVKTLTERQQSRQIQIQAQACAVITKKSWQKPRQWNGAHDLTFYFDSKNGIWKFPCARNSCVAELSNSLFWIFIRTEIGEIFDKAATIVNTAMQSSSVLLSLSPHVIR